MFSLSCILFYSSFFILSRGLNWSHITFLQENGNTSWTERFNLLFFDFSSSYSSEKCWQILLRKYWFYLLVYRSALLLFFFLQSVSSQATAALSPAILPTSRSSTPDSNVAKRFSVSSSASSHHEVCKLIAFLFFQVLGLNFSVCFFLRWGKSAGQNRYGWHNQIMKNGSYGK